MFYFLAMPNFLLLLMQVFAITTLTFAALRLGREVLVSWIALCSVLANLFVLKQIALFTWHVTCSDAPALGCVLGLNVLQERFGKEAAKRGLYASFFAMAGFALLGRLHLLFSPSSVDATQSAYEAVLGHAPRLLCASLSAFFGAEWADLHLFSLMRRKWTGTPLWLRNGTSLMLSQLLDTSLFTLLGLWGVVEHLGHVLAFSFAIKCTLILALTPLLALYRPRALPSTSK